ncbi:hypothetical protein GCM10010399_57010 [Dactylosporangium fulvum]|uniref:Prohibitin family protein n=1 Tax=Dactylosporangium fulvum TaxID=53359 RepID=A0ABY5VVK9_9ACTN|nr:hypothetical protein [Dactylosporangium fulvum]UWP80834.1 hypothetical protein Dfulv_37725 [Dactylosporangium fulvum]
MLLGFIGVIVGIVVASRGSAQAVTGAFVSKGGQFVELAKADERFAYTLSQAGVRS